MLGLSFLAESTLPNEPWNFIVKSPHRLMGSKLGSTSRWCFLGNAKRPSIKKLKSNLIKISYANIISLLLQFLMGSTDSVEPIETLVVFVEIYPMIPILFGITQVEVLGFLLFENHN